MKALVTGGAGFIGSHIVDRLLDDKYEVSVIDSLFASGTKQNLSPKAKFYKADIRGKEIEKIFKKEKPDVVFHEAAQIDVGTSIQNPILDADVNLMGTLKLFSICLENKVKKVIIPSSAAVYGEPKHFPTSEDVIKYPTMPYAFGKLAMEQYAEFYSKFYKLDITILRYANVYGPRQESPGEGVVVQKFIIKYLNDEKPTINGDGNQTRDFIFVSDVVEANLLAIKVKKFGPFNISTSKEISVNDLAEIVSKMVGCTKEPKYGSAKPNEVYRSCLDNKLASKLLGWKPQVSIDEGLKKTIDWFKKREG